MKSMASFIVNFEYVSKIFGSADYFRTKNENEDSKMLMFVFDARVHLNMLQYEWTNEFVIESLEFIANIIIASFADDVFHAGHQMIN